MKEYPRLTEMGVLNPLQINRFAINSIKDTDYLLIVYKRPKGSFLPVSRTYEFPRVEHSAASHDGKDKKRVIMRSSPEFREALKELKQIVSIKTTRKGITDAMKSDIRQLEEEFALHLASLKSLIDDIEKMD